MLLAAILAAPCIAELADDSPAAKRPPNIVIIFIDDMGYADVGPFGATDYETPNLDRMAREGRVFTDFHAAAVCSESRAALLTGCYSERVGIRGALMPDARHGLNPDEATIADVCRSRGYATALFGKWHLGHREPYLPLQQGFDEFYGLPYSNDMWPYHPEVISPPAGTQARRSFPDLPLYDGNRIDNSAVGPEDQAQLTKWYTERAVDFIDRHRDQPFFLYVPHTMVHVPLYVSEEFRDRSGAGLYGDVVMEIDWSVGQILAAIRRNGLDDNTLVVFTSDNGPWLSYGEHAGSAGSLREGKSTTFEGGTRVPCIMRWPGRIPAGSRCDEMATTMDLLPTVARLIGAELSADRTIDGKDIGPLIVAEPGAVSPHDVVYCYYNGELRAVRDRRWKLYFPHRYQTLGDRPGGRDGMPADYEQAETGTALYDLSVDVGEMNNIAAEHPEVVTRLSLAAERARDALGDALTGRVGREVRPAGRLPD